jgi:hypothetical protein
MSENYKITKEIGLRIVELRQEEGLTFPKISAKIKAEFGVDVVRSSIERFYKNVLKGNSRILPKDVVNVQVKPADRSQTVKPLNRLKHTENTIADFSILDGLSTEKNSYGTKRPSDELLSLFTPKPRSK